MHAVTGLTLADISDLRAYERQRDAFRREVIALKKIRRVQLGPIVTVVFESRVTVRFQVQEMARAERMATDAEVQAELDVYNSLVPAPGELSMTVFVELVSEAELREWLPKLVGIEKSLALRLGAGAQARRVGAVVEPSHASQLTREEVTASVHYVRIALDPAAAGCFGAGPAWLVSDHPHYRHEAELSPATRASIVADWSGR